MKLPCIFFSNSNLSSFTSTVVGMGQSYHIINIPDKYDYHCMNTTEKFNRSDMCLALEQSKFISWSSL